MNKKWEIREQNNELTEDIAKKYNLSEITAKILASKNLNDKELEKYLNPTRADFYDPFLMPDMNLAIERIMEAIKNKERIVVYGDYDADGITSTTILKRFFKDRGIDIGTYIPNRLDEGYGLNQEAIRHIAEEGYKLMITVDCGITAIEEVKLAKELGIDIIITDHHETLDEIPDAIAVIDCKRKDNTYPFNQLAGCGVAFKLTQALCIEMKLNENEALKYLDIACVGTISDIVPLVDENRVIAKLGLKLVKQTKNLGLRSILQQSGYRKIDSNSISFGVSPRINACGRMGHQEDALELFLTDDPIEARRLSQKLEDFNKLRQETEKNIYQEALELIEKNKEDNNPCIVIGKEGWHHGVIGIVSSKITEKYYKPSILICFEGEDSKGSGRSIQGFDLHEAAVKCSKHLKAYGGHSMAIGLSLKTNEFEDFKQEFEEYSKDKITADMVPELIIDEVVEKKDISINSVEELNVLEPFGEANNMPVFLYKGLKVLSIRSLSEGKHLKLTLQDDNVLIDTIGFNLGELVDKYQIGDKLDVVGNLEVNEFNNIKRIQINIKDIRKSIE